MMSHNKDYIYSGENSGISKPDDALKDMTSVMTKETPNQPIDELKDKLNEQRNMINNVVRENRTLRIKNTNSQNEIRNLKNTIHYMEQDIQLLKNVLVEFNERIDFIENNAIIKNKK